MAMVHGVPHLVEVPCDDEPGVFSPSDEGFADTLEISHSLLACVSFTEVYVDRDEMNGLSSSL